MYVFFGLLLYQQNHQQETKIPSWNLISFPQIQIPDLDRYQRTQGRNEKKAEKEKNTVPGRPSNATPHNRPIEHGREKAK